MSTSLDQAWASAQPGEITPDSMPPAGRYIAHVTSTKCDRSKKGEDYIVVEWATQQGHSWGDYRGLTQNGVPQEGRIKAAKVMLRQLGVPDCAVRDLPAMLQQVVGRHYQLEIVASSDINPTTGAPYYNTNIIGAAAGPVAPAPAQSDVPATFDANVASPPVSAQPPAQAPAQQQPAAHPAAAGQDVPWT